MSEGVIIALIGVLGLIITSFFTFISLKATLKNNLAVLAANIAVNQKIDSVAINEKVDKYHKEVNGKMGQLIETTKQLATAKEKAKNKEEDEKT